MLTVNLTIINQVKAQPSPEIQVNQVADFFTGIFDNNNQVSTTPNIPYLTMTNCSVNLVGSGNITSTRPIYLEQRIGGFEQTNSLLRSRFYSFNQGNNVVDLSVYSFVNQNSVLGLCNQPEYQREIEVQNIIDNSCDLALQWQSDNFYTGNNSPLGCPTRSGGKVISQVEISPNLVFSLDQIFAPNGTFLFGTPIEFEKINTTSVPESNFTFGLLFLGIISVYSHKKRAN